MSRDWRLYLDDMLEACRKVERYTDGLTFAAFRDDERTYDAVRPRSTFPMTCDARCRASTGGG